MMLIMFLIDYVGLDIFFMFQMLQQMCNIFVAHGLDNFYDKFVTVCSGACNDWQTGVKTLPSCNFFAGGNKISPV